MSLVKEFKLYCIYLLNWVTIWGFVWPLVKKAFFCGGCGLFHLQKWGSFIKQNKNCSYSRMWSLLRFESKSQSLEHIMHIWLKWLLEWTFLWRKIFVFSFQVLETFYYEDIGEVSTVKKSGLQLVMHTGGRVVLSTPKAGIKHIRGQSYKTFRRVFRRLTPLAWLS